MALPGSTPSARPGLRGSWAELCLCRAQGPQRPPLGGVPARPAHAGTSHRPHHTPGDPVSPLGSETGSCASQVCAMRVCVCARSHPCTHGSCTCVHTSVLTHIARTCTHSLLPLRFAFAPGLSGAAETRRKRVCPPGGSSLVVQPVAVPPRGWRQGNSDSSKGPPAGGEAGVESAEYRGRQPVSPREGRNWQSCGPRCAQLGGGRGSSWPG